MVLKKFDLFLLLKAISSEKTSGVIATKYAFFLRMLKKNFPKEDLAYLESCEFFPLRVTFTKTGISRSFAKNAHNIAGELSV